MAKLTRLKINKFRNVEPVELKFSRGINVLLGINGSGKTTFLELIAAILSQDLSKIRDEEFSVEYTVGNDHQLIHIHIENRQVRHDHTDRPLRMHRGALGEFALNVQTQAYFNALGIEYSAKSTKIETQLTIEDKDGQITSEVWDNSALDFDSEFLYAAFAPLRKPEISWPKVAALELGSVIRFDESLGVLDFLQEEDDGWIESLGNSSTPQTGLEFWSDWRASGALINSLWKASCENWPSWKESETITLTAREIPWLESLVHLAELKDAKLELRLLSKRPYELENENLTLLKFGMLRFWFEKIDGTIIPEQKLSYGQKRLLSFLYYLDCNPHIIIADELANGLHHAWITACIDAIGDRQAFLASQNPLLLDEIDLSSVEDVERSFVLCRCDTSSGKERLVWSNMTTYDAERFFEAYNVGLQHVSEILRTKRLW